MSQLPNGWESIALSELAKFIDYRGKTPKKTESGIPLITAKNIKDGYINREPREYIAEADYDKWMTRGIPQVGDVLLTTEAPLGNSAQIDIQEKFALAQRAICFQFHERSISRFVYYFLRSPLFKEELGLNATGSTVKGIKAATLKKLEVNIPPLAEQTRIVEKLDEVLAQVDTIKARLDGIPAILKRFRQSVLAAAVSGKLTEEWRGKIIDHDESGSFSVLNEFRGKSLKDLPSNWKWVRFDAVNEVASNLVDPLENPRDYHIAPNHIESKSGRLLDYTTVEEDKVKSSKHRFYSGQVLYSKIRPYLCKAVLVDFTGVCSADMYPLNTKMEPKYLLSWLLSDQFTEWASNGDSRTVLPKINKKQLSEIPCPLPPIEEQKEIVRLVDQYFAFADTIETQVKKAQARVDKLTQSILAKAFRGELVAQDPSDEPADKLLEPIAAASKEADALAKAVKKAGRKATAN